MSCSIDHLERRRVLAREDKKLNRMLRNHNIRNDPRSHAVKKGEVFLRVKSGRMSFWSRITDLAWEVWDFVSRPVRKKVAPADAPRKIGESDAATK